MLQESLDNGRTTVGSEGKVWEVVWTMVTLRSDQRAQSHYSLIKSCMKLWTMVALRTDQRAKSHYILIIGRTEVWTMVALRSDQRAKSGKWSGQWSNYGLIRGQSREMVWTMVALRTDQRAKSHYILIIGRTEVWTMVALRSDQRAKSGIWSGQWSNYGLIRGQSREMVWTMVALRTDQRAKSHYILIIGRTEVWTMVTLRSDQRAKSGKWSGQWSNYGLIRGRSREMVWTMVALRTDQRAKPHYILIISCMKLWTMIAHCGLISGQNRTIV